MRESDGIHAPVLQWAIIDGRLRYLPDLNRSERAAALCPVCKRQVILKLGPERVHHIAHHPGDLCIASQPETVIHLNAKFHLQSMLKSATSIFFNQRCGGCKELFNSCSHEHAVKYIRDWDRVETEWSLGPYRLDVALLRDEEVVGAIEVMVSHPCENDKVACLNNENVPWLEIQVTPEFYTLPDAWLPSQALVPTQFNPNLVQPWQCHSCQDRDAARRKEKVARELKQQEREKKREYAKQFELLALRLVDFYYPHGKKYRSLYAIERWAGKGSENAIIQLQEIGIVRRKVATFDRTCVGEPLAFLKGRLKDELSSKKKNSGWIVDDSRDWMKPPERFHPKMFMDLDKYPYGYEWDGNVWEKAISWQEKLRAAAVRYREPIPVEEQAHEESKTVYEQPTLFDVEYTCRECGEKTKDCVTKYDSKTCLCRKCAYRENN